MHPNYSKSQIKELANPIFVAEALGLQIKKMGKHYSILCPCHEDRHFGSCYLTDAGYHCFSCGAKGDIFELVSAVQGIGFSESCNYLGHLLGLEPKKHKRIEKKKKLPDKSTLNLLGIAENKGLHITVGCSTELPNLEANQHYEWYPDDNGGYYVIYETIDKNPLQSLYENDERAYRTMMCNHAKEMYLRWLDIERDILKDNGPSRSYLKKIIEVFGKDFFVNYIRNDIMSKLEKLMRVLKQQRKR